MFKRLFQVKGLTELLREAQGQGESGLKRSLGLWDIVCLAIGATIGAGIFVTVGLAASGGDGQAPAGPGIALSFLLVGVACILCALCFCELAAAIPVAGGAYTYAYAIVGEYMAWIVGWCLILEYLVSAVAVAISWSGYFASLLKSAGIIFPAWLCTPSQLATPEIFAAAPSFLGLPIVFNLPALIVTLILMGILIVGVSVSAKANRIMVVIKLITVFLVVIAGAFFVDSGNWHPFAPGGFAGIQAGAALVFFAYLGFDAVTTMAEETKNPSHDLPIGMIIALIVSTFVYITVALVLTGMMKYNLLGVTDPVALVFNSLGLHWIAGFVAAGALVAITAVLLVLLMSQPRIFYSMARDGLLPQSWCRIHPKFKTPYVTTLITCGLVALASCFCDVRSVAQLTNIGTLFVFCVVCVGVIVFRYTNPQANRPFKVPLMPWLPLLGVASCLVLMIAMPWATWVRFLIWLAIGSVVYFVYGMRHSHLHSSDNEANQ